MERMQRMGPEFVDITWGAGGSSADLTTEIVSTAQSVYGLETMMHLTCTNMEVEKIDTALKVNAKREGRGCVYTDVMFIRRQKIVGVRTFWLYEVTHPKAKATGNQCPTASNTLWILCAISASNTATTFVLA